MKKRIDRNATFCLLVGLMIIMSSLFVAYSALKTTLTITNGKVNQNAMTWKVGFVPGTVTGVGKNGTETCGTATVTENEIKGFSTVLTKPGDQCTYEVTLKNSGTIDAEITNISSIQTTSGKGCGLVAVNIDGKWGNRAICGYLDSNSKEAIFSKISYDGENDWITTFDVIEKNSSKKIYFTVFYSLGVVAEEDDIFLDRVGFKLDFGQK